MNRIFTRLTTLHSTTFQWISAPLWMLAFGLLLFFSQMAIGWWDPLGFSNTALSISSAVTCLTLLFIGTKLGIDFGIHFFRIEKHVAWRIPFILLCIYIICAFLFSLKPAHLIQESDFANYHLFLPKQAWLKQSWSGLDRHPFAFLHMGVQWALSFIWVGLPLLNRLPQFIFSLFLTLTLLYWPNLITKKQTSKTAQTGLLTACLFWGFRGTTLQAGTAMLDLTNTYLLIISLIAFWTISTELTRGETKTTLFNLAILGLSTGFYLAHKSFASILWIGYFAITTAVAWQLNFKKIRLSFLLKQILPAIFLAITIWLPSLVQSLHFTGDPLFPVFSIATEKFCRDENLKDTSCKVVLQKSIYLQNTKNAYGYGHAPSSILNAFFTVALPDRNSVNNRFDYPIGLNWYLAWILILFAWRQREIRICAVAIVAGFVFWSIGSQQSRWLYPTIVAISATAAQAIVHLNLKRRKFIYIAVAAITFSLSANTIRMVRAHRTSLTCSGEQCLATNAKYIRDYKIKCPIPPLTDLGERGYLNCAAE